MKFRVIISLFLAVLLLGASACGNKGDLYLPDEEDKKKTERRTY